MSFTPRTDIWLEPGHFDQMQQIHKELERVPVQESGDWTPVVRGSGTAGTYELTIAEGRFTRIGHRIFLDFRIGLAGVVTGGGTGSLEIAGLPVSIRSGSNAFGTAMTHDLNHDAGVISLAWEYNTSTNRLNLQQIRDSASPVPLSITAIGGAEFLKGHISYEIIQ